MESGLNWSHKFKHLPLSQVLLRIHVDKWDEYNKISYDSFILYKVLVKVYRQNLQDLTLKKAEDASKKTKNKVFTCMILAK